MGNIVINQAAKFLSKRRNTRRWIAAVLCLALVVTSGTFGMLTRHGSALSDEKVLDCAFEVHQHSDACYDEAGKLVCGYADYCIHTHNEDCYDSDGNLVCRLPEIKAHVHDDSCFEEEQHLVCELEEQPEGHQHTEECYDIELGELTCGMEEHIHDDSCYELIPEGEEIPEETDEATAETPAESQEPVASEAPAESQEPAASEAPAESQEPAATEAPAENQEPVATEAPAASETPVQEEVAPAENQAAPASEPAVQNEEPAAEGEVALADGLVKCAENRRLICGMEEHTHSDACHEQIKTLKCGKEEGSDPHTHTEECYVTEKVATCGQLELHTHTEACYTDGKLTCGKLELVEHVHTEECFKYPVKELSQKVGDVTIIVSAYEEGAIPDDAELSVTPIERKEITEEMDEEEKVQAEEQNAQYDGVAEKLQEKAEEEEYEIAGFLAYDICFIDADGNKIEPNGEVKVSIMYEEAVKPEEMQNLDSATFALEQSDEEAASDGEAAEEGLGVTVMHLEEDEAGEVAQVTDMAEADKVEALEVTENQEVQKAEFLTDSFSTFVITWTNYYRTAKITVNYVDVNGNEITGPQTEGVWKETYNNETELKDYAGYIVDYTFEKITIESPDGQQVGNLRYNDKKIQYQKGQWNNGDWSRTDNTWTKWLDVNRGEEAKGNVYIVYKYTPSEIPGSQASAPNHRKYIEKNAADDYTLTLDVTGKQDAARPIDILLIVDKSGSMNEDNNGRYKNVNTAITALKNSLQTAVNNNEGLEVNFGVVTFSSAGAGTNSTRDNDTGQYSYDRSDSDADAQVAQDWIGINDFSWSLQSVDGGTNWQAGVKTGENMLAQRPADNRKYVVFITDGDPTYRYYTGNNTITQGTGRTDPESNNYNAAVNEWNASPTLKSTVGRYVIDANPTGDNKCDEFATAIGGTELSGTNSTSMTNSFNQIANNIINPGYTNVKITDSLSEYVDFIECDEQTGEPILTVESRIGENSTRTTLRKEIDYTITWDDSTNANKTYEAGCKTFTVNLSGVGKLANDTIYSVSFHVKPTQKAADDYTAEGGYIVGGSQITGDENTDAPDVAEENYTSSGKEGFYSNDAKNTKLTYTYNDGTPEDVDYPKPVVQVDPSQLIDIPTVKNPVDGSITKTMGTVTEDGKYPITLEVKTRLEEDQQDAKIDVVLVIDLSNSMKNNSVLQPTKDAAKAFVENFVGKSGTTNENHRVGIVTFNSSAKEQLAFTGNAKDVLEKIDSLSISGGNDGGTNTEAGFVTAKALAAKSSNRKYVIFMTDGVPTFRNSGNGYTNDSHGDQCSVSEYNKAVDAAVQLKNTVNGVYTIGLLKNMTERQMDIARRLLASNNPEHQRTGYTECYKPTAISGDEISKGDGTVTWNTQTSYTYSDGYFEVTDDQNASAALEAVWTELATIMNNLTTGSTGDGWTITDKMADYTNFLALDGAAMNGHALTLSDDRKKLTTTLGEGAAEFIVAEYDSTTGTITWHLNSELAEKSIKYQKGTDYTYRLTYYVDFADSGSTELRNTNKTTYIDIPDRDDNIYPDEMPYFINVVGSKVDIDTNATTLAGAKFKVYRDIDEDGKGKTLLTEVSSDQNGHFAFQIGQTDLTDDSMTVYLEETEAPKNYEKDTVLHPITIQVSDVQYKVKADSKPDCIIDSAVGADWGSVSGTVSITHRHNPEIEGDLLSVTTEGGLKLLYKNTKKTPWGIIKRSASSKDVTLTGAEFGLYKVVNDVPEETASYTATSGQDGKIDKWEKADGGSEVDSLNIETGVYELREITAPAGYVKSEEVWIVTVSAGDVTITEKIVGDDTATEIEQAAPVEGNKTVYYYFDNEVVYELPSTGGSGIYWYSIGGMLMMCAAALILYRTKTKRVRGCRRA